MNSEKVVKVLILTEEQKRKIFESKLVKTLKMQESWVEGHRSISGGVL